jgi:hypothetical protein
MTNLIYATDEVMRLRDEVHTTAVSKGWWPELENIKPAPADRWEALSMPRRIKALVLVVSELSEAYEEYRKPDITITQIYIKDGKPEGFPIEVADAYIRVLDLMGALDVKYDERHFRTDAQVHDLEDVSSFIFDILKVVVYVGSSGYWGDLPTIITTIEGACIKLGIDLRTAVSNKMEYNKTRSFRHGGKRA